MFNATSARRGNLARRSGRSIVTAVTATTLAAVCSLLPCPTARAVQLSIISPGFPLVNATTGNYAVRYSYVAQAAVGVFANSNHDSQTFYPLKGEVDGVPALETSATVPSGIWTNSSSVSQDAHGGAGTIGGHVKITVTDGPSSASTDIILDFIDKIHMNNDCDLVINPHISGSAQRMPSTPGGSEFAQTNAEFDTYFFSAVNPPPTAGTAFTPGYYGRVDVNSTGQTLTEARNTTVFPAGTDWWFVARLELRAGANIPFSTQGLSYPGDVLTAVGDFEHTAFTTLDDPNNGPDPVYTSASGIDYSTAALVPEPSTLTITAVGLAAVGLAALCRRRRCF